MNTENLYTVLATVQKGARARLLSDEDVDNAVAAYDRGVALAISLGVDASTVCVQRDGGSVAKSYGARAERTLIVIVNGKARIVRAQAPESGQSYGSLVLSMGFPASLKTGKQLPTHRLTEHGRERVGAKLSGRACW